MNKPYQKHIHDLNVNKDNRTEKLPFIIGEILDFISTTMIGDANADNWDASGCK